MSENIEKVDTKSTDEKYNYGTGRRKTAVAQVRLMTGNGRFLVNDKPVELYPELSNVLDQVGLTNKVDISAHVSGGGKIGQIIAIRHGLARSLIDFDITFRPTLKKLGLLTRDPREKERQKFGLHGARRGPQFSKR
ncbi:MAG: 30S ribosomal protein S9 [Patescibacteria group bacterium]|jgi:small subunit ribosomal protein S9